MIPGGFFAEVIFALGLALAGANIVALVRPWWLKRQGHKNVQEVGSKMRSYVNIAIGLIVMIWGLASMLHG
jgi:ABC-type nickel/cobalt efflux system permease component RcnA